MVKDFVCSAPWQGMFINPDGDFRVCCAGKSLGNLNKKTIVEIVNDTPIQQVRNDMRTQGYSMYCENCMRMEETQGHSLRNQFIKSFDKFDSSIYNPTITDVRWRNTCHLKCVYCNSQWSSAYAQWEGKTERVSEIDWQQDVLTFLQSHKRDFVMVNLLGGEPLLLKENLEFLKVIDSNVKVDIVTNLSVENVEELPVYQELLKRKVNWLISLEATGNKFEYIRRNAKWEITKKNYENLCLSNESHKGIHMTYCTYSAFTLTETFDWLREIEPDPNKNFSHISVCLGPDIFCIYNFPASVKQAAIAEIDKLLAKHTGYLTANQISIVKNIQQSLTDSMNNVNKKVVASFLEHIRINDREMAPIKFAEEWPELNKLLFFSMRV